MSALLRPGLALLATVELTLGLWTLLFPAHFYTTMPTVDLTPPYSEHVFRDFGGATLGLAIALTAAAVWLERRLVTVALTSYLAFAVPHLAFHLDHLHGATALAATALVAVLIGEVLLPVALLILTMRSMPQTPERDAGATGGPTTKMPPFASSRIDVTTPPLSIHQPEQSTDGPRRSP